MQTEININGVAFAPYAMSGGIQQSVVQRQGRAVETLSGLLYKSDVEKRIISMQLVEIRDSTLTRLIKAVTPLSTVEYDDIRGYRRTAKFYVSVTNAIAKRVVGGNTYYSGVTVQLEEK